jgi:hypothetical protein
MAVCAISPAAAQDLDISLNSDAAQFQVSYPLDKHKQFPKGELNGSLIFSTDDDMIVGVGARVAGETGSATPGLSAGLGARLFGGSAEDNGMAALALNGALRYSPPPFPRFGIGMEFFYAPNIVTFIEADNYLHWELRVEYEVLPESYVYVGFRKLRVGLEDDDEDETDVDSGGHIGLKIHF